MKKTLSVLALFSVIAIVCAPSSEAFTWSSLNPFKWGRCNKCENKVQEQPCPTGYATPCDPCQKSIPQQKPCDPCDKLQQHMSK